MADAPLAAKACEELWVGHRDGRVGVGWEQCVFPAKLFCKMLHTACAGDVMPL